MTVGSSITLRGHASLSELNRQRFRRLRIIVDMKQGKVR
jgi:hypothetical protein